MKAFKRLASLFLAGLIFVGQLPTFAQTSLVKISFPTFPVTINSLEIDNGKLEYPLITYNNITYFPMTYHFSKGLGLNIDYSQATGLAISYEASSNNTLSVNYLEMASPNQSQTAELPSYPIKVNGIKIDNRNETYPLLNYKGITYFPLTWRFAVENFGWQYSFNSVEGLKISSSGASNNSGSVPDVDTGINDKTPASNVASYAINDYPSAEQIDTQAYSNINDLDYSINLPNHFNSYNSMGSNVNSLFVRDQGDSSTCWAFAANTLFEISLAKQHQVYLDFSEDHLILNAPIEVNYDSGGYIDVATSYYNNWFGPIVDPNDRFGDGVTNNNIKPEYVISDYIEIENNLEAIKYAVYEFGATQSSIGYDENRNYYNESTYGFYNNDFASPPTHDIVIVGWDDDYSKDNFNASPEKNGAFIVQNSWGNEWGENGLFYVSYEDAHILNKATAITSIQKITRNIKQYSYNDTGITHFEGYSDYYQATGLNVFTSSPKTESGIEYLTSVGFYTNSMDVKFTISFAETGVPESAYLDMTKIASGTAAMPGYHTVNLTTPIKLVPDKPFSVAVTFENEDTIFLVPLEAPYPDIQYVITGNLNESYISPDPEYYGFTDIGAERPSSNIGIRAITEFK